MLMEYRPEIGIGDRVITTRDIKDAEVPLHSYGTVVGERDGCIPRVFFVNFDHLLLRDIKRTVVMQYEIRKIFPASLIPSTWDGCSWNPTGETHG